MSKKKCPVADSEIIDWIDSVTSEKYFWSTITIHNSSDMGYKKDFVSVTVSDKHTGKGNSVREALSDAFRKATS